MIKFRPMQNAIPNHQLSGSKKKPSELHPAFVKEKLMLQSSGIVDKSSPPRDNGALPSPTWRVPALPPPLHAGAFSQLKGLAHARAPSVVESVGVLPPDRPQSTPRWRPRHGCAVRECWSPLGRRK